jgi:Tol biopolymer transport system component
MMSLGDSIAVQVAVLLLVLVGLSLVWVGVSAGAKDDTILVSRASGPGGVKGNGYRAAVSADGRFVAFESTAPNIHPEADEPPYVRDVVVRDLLTDTPTLVSRAAGPAGAAGNGHSGAPSISAEGRFVAFGSGASNLHPDDSGDFSDVFVRDLQSDTTTLVTRAAGPTGTASNGSSSSPAISADGRFVAFTSEASNLHPDDADSAEDVFVRDLQSDTTTLVSRASGPSGAAANNEISSFSPPSISANGRFVAFSSSASNLRPGDTNDIFPEIFVRDLQANTTEAVSRASGPAHANGNSYSGRSSISADGRFVVFTSDASNLHPADRDESHDVFLRDLHTDRTVLVSRASGGSGAKGYESQSPSISSDGRLVAFQSYASNLHPYDTNHRPDVFVRDLQAHTTTLVSRAAGPAGANGVGGSHDPSISAHGRFVAFESRSRNLDPDDTDRSGDIFVRELGPLPLPRPPRIRCGRERATMVLMPRDGRCRGLPNRGRDRGQQARREDRR